MMITGFLYQYQWTFQHIKILYINGTGIQDKGCLMILVDQLLNVSPYGENRTLVNLCRDSMWHSRLHAKWLKQELVS